MIDSKNTEFQLPVLDNYKQIAILGSGAWGTALGLILARAGHGVTIVGRDPQVISTINHQHQHPDIRTATLFPLNLQAKQLQTADAAFYQRQSLLLSVIPVQVTGETLINLPLPTTLPIVLCSKGIDIKHQQLLTEVLHSRGLTNPLLVLSGASFAAEIIAGTPAALTLAGTDPNLLQQTAELLTTPQFTLTTTNDIAGVQIAGALKNVYAIATGMAMAQNPSENWRAYIITQALAEMISFGQIFKAQTATFYGPAGIADLVLCCTSEQSRNYRLGLKLGSSALTPSKSKLELTEGLHTLRIAYRLAKLHQLSLPLLFDTYQRCFPA